MKASKEEHILCKPRFRIMVGERIALGPGKIDLLEAIRRNGSISRAARDIKLSYRRAWDMVDAMNQCFKKPLVTSSTGGKGGGGATLTPLGERMILHYRAMEKEAEKSTRGQWKSIKQYLQEPNRR